MVLLVLLLCGAGVDRCPRCYSKEFCGTHRYAEAHHCTHDYGKSHREHIRKENPLMKTPKLKKV